MNMHRTKSTEFAKVVLVDVATQTPAEAELLTAMDDSERGDTQLRARSLTYVAASRARDELVVRKR